MPAEAKAGPRPRTCMHVNASRPEADPPSNLCHARVHACMHANAPALCSGRVLWACAPTGV
eukprot:364073-Chlamydomonas_euryale.AAC.7